MFVRTVQTNRSTWPAHSRTFALAGVLLGLITLSPKASAVLLVYEGFQGYLVGQTLPTMALGIGWTPGPWTGSTLMIDQPPTLTHPTAAPSTGDGLFNT